MVTPSTTVRSLFPDPDWRRRWNTREMDAERGWRILHALNGRMMAFQRYAKFIESDESEN